MNFSTIILRVHLSNKTWMNNSKLIKIQNHCFIFWQEKKSFFLCNLLCTLQCYSWDKILKIYINHFSKKYGGALFLRDSNLLFQLLIVCSCILGPHSQYSLKEIPKFLQNLRLQYNILKMYFQLIFWFHVCYCNWGLAFISKNCNFM